MYSEVLFLRCVINRTECLEEAIIMKVISRSDVTMTKVPMHTQFNINTGCIPFHFVSVSVSASVCKQK